MEIDTKTLDTMLVTEILTKTRFSAMAALICILRVLPKDDRVASFRFLKRTFRRNGNSKKKFVRMLLQGSAKFWDSATGL